MASEITKLDGDGGLNARVLFLYLTLTPNTYPIDGGGMHTVVPTPSTDLPAMAAEILTAAEKAALGAGTAAFEIVTFPISDALTNVELLAAARALYATKKADFVAREARKYNRAGQRFNEV